MAQLEIITGTGALAPDLDPHFTRSRILMPCSATKRVTGSSLPLWQLYRGPLWLTLVSRLTGVQVDGGGVIALSALYGWQRAGAYCRTYELRLSKAAAEWMIDRGVFGGCDQRARTAPERDRASFAAHGSLRIALHDARVVEPVDQLVVAGAGLYRDVMLAGIAAAAELGLVAPGARVWCVAGGIGEQRSQLGRWASGIGGAL